MDDLAAKLQGGFSTNARADLDRVRRDTRRSAEDRGRATWHLAKWEASRENWRRCAELLDASPERDGKVGKDVKFAILLAEAYIRTNRPHQAVKLLERNRRFKASEDIQLSLANALLRKSRKTADSGGDQEAERLRVLNRLLSRENVSEIRLIDLSGGLCFGNLRSDTPPVKDTDLPRISILMAVHNAEEFLETSLRSMLDQTWTNIEIVACDDASEDRSWEILNGMAAQDGRLHVLRNARNAGAYATRNRALAAATGDLVTVHDSDDWSHPQMLELQARALLGNQVLKATFSMGARVLPDMEFSLRPERDAISYMHRNYPSLLVRRSDMERLGSWDTVRAGADDELVQRARALWGREAFLDVLPKTPLSFFLRHEQSLTHQKGTRLGSLAFGIRREYAQQAAFWQHGNQPDSDDAARFALDRTDSKTPFPAPARLMPDRGGRTASYDLILVSDLSLLGGTRRCNEGYIAAATALGYRVGLFHWPRYDLTLRPDIDVEYRRMSYQPNVDILVPEDVVECDTVLIHHPPILKYPIDAVPQVTTRQVAILVNQSPMHLRSAVPRYYFPDQVRELTLKFFGHEPLWLPISPLTRRILQETGGYGHVSETNWTPPLGRDLPEGDPPSRKGIGTSRQIVLGRHSRDHATKWPETPSAINAAYCANTDIAVWLMGGVRTPKKLLGDLPENWRIIGFDEIPVEDFISNLDFFVHFVSDDYIEEFGRNIMEAMANGVPTILPAVFRETFGDAAIYCAPNEVESVIRRLWQDELGYAEMSRRGLAFVEAECSNRVVKARLRSLLGVG